MRISVEGVTFSYNSVNTLDGITFCLEKGSILSILGPNGSGKTTLLKILCSLLPPKEGRVLVDGEELVSIPLRARARLLGYVPQRSETFNTTVFEAVLTGRRPHVELSIGRKDIEIVEEVLELVGLSSMKSRSLFSLSGGEFQKVIIARALAQRPKVLLLDEPLTYLDVKNQIEVAQLIRRATRELSLITVMVLHDINLALQYCDLFLLLKEGKIYAMGGREALTEESIGEVFGIKVGIVEIGGRPHVFVKEREAPWTGRP